jgi:alkylation response protein AidB-like acyl-CoA dehydrogenase
LSAESHSLSFREPPVEPGPLYTLPTVALFAAAIAAVPLGIARHAIELLTGLAAIKITSRTRRSVSEDATLQADLGRAEALVRSGRAFLYEALEEAWAVVSAGQRIDIAQRAMLWLAGAHAARNAAEAAELMFRAGGSASPYASCGIAALSPRHPRRNPAHHAGAGQLPDGSASVSRFGHEHDAAAAPRRSRRLFLIHANQTVGEEHSVAVQRTCALQRTD